MLQHIGASLLASALIGLATLALMAWVIDGAPMMVTAMMAAPFN